MREQAVLPTPLQCDILCILKRLDWTKSNRTGQRHIEKWFPRSGGFPSLARRGVLPEMPAWRGFWLQSKIKGRSQSSSWSATDTSIYWFLTHGVMSLSSKLYHRARTVGTIWEELAGDSCTLPLRQGYKATGLEVFSMKLKIWRKWKSSAFSTQ